MLYFILIILSLNSVHAGAPVSKQEINLSFAPIVKKIEPAIVSIYTTQLIERQINPLFDEDFFNQFFLYPQLPRQEMAKSMGSGVMIDDKGTIVTCAHVVHNSKEIKVKLSDNREFPAKINVVDTQNDIAILSLEKVSEKIPFVSLVNQDDSESGDLVLAFGNPFGIGHTVTNGIISAKTRNVDGRVLLQTDAPINPGNSGGALINMKGELIGIPNAILSKTGANLGIGFAIPVSTIKPLLGLSAKDGKYIRPWIGFKVETLDADKAESFGLKGVKGIFVMAIHDLSPAKKEGLQQGDVISAVDDNSIESKDAFDLKMLEMKPDQELTLTVHRKGEEKKIKTKAILPPGDKQEKPIKIAGRNPLAGCEIANLTPAMASELGLDSMLTGVIIVKGAARANGFGLSLFQAGDIIEETDGETVKSVDDFRRLVKDGMKSMVVRRGNQRLTFKVG
jgi:serine protease Do